MSQWPSVRDGKRTLPWTSNTHTFDGRGAPDTDNESLLLLPNPSEGTLISARATVRQDLKSLHIFFPHIFFYLIQKRCASSLLTIR